MSALHQLEQTPDAKLFRPELWREAKRANAAFERGGFESMRLAAWAVRNRTRSAGRKLPSRSVSRTLLVKGLEFDHVLVADADEFEDPRLLGDGARNFYVAATRGARSLTVLSSTRQLRFSAPTL